MPNTGKLQPDGRAVKDSQGGGLEKTFDGIVARLDMEPPMMPNHKRGQDAMFVMAAFIVPLRERS